jgi:hypothetical protein
VPIPLKPGAAAETTFITGEAAPAAGSAPVARVTLRVQFKSPPGPETVKVSLNGAVLPGGTVRGEWIEFPLLPGQVRAGANTVRLELAAGAAAAVWTDLHCTVRPPGS